MQLLKISARFSVAGQVNSAAILLLSRRATYYTHTYIVYRIYIPLVVDDIHSATVATVGRVETGRTMASDVFN